MNITKTFGPEIADVHFSESESGDLAGIASEIYFSLRDVPEDLALDALLKTGQQSGSLFPKLRDALGELVTHESWKVMVMHGPPPIDTELGPTPVRYLKPKENPILKTDICRALILGMAGVYPYGYDSQQPGNIHNNVVAIKSFEGKKGISANAADRLGLHNEDASYNLSEYNISPDWLTIQALRNPALVPSLVSLPNIGNLPTSTRRLLEEDFFVNHTNPGQGGDENNAQRPVSVLYGPDGQWIRLNTEQLDMDKHSIRHAEALQTLVDMASEATIELDFLPGDIVINDNRRVLHGRARYLPHQAPKYDGTDRWQRRVVAADESARIQQFEVEPRIVSPREMFAAISKSQ